MSRNIEAVGAIGIILTWLVGVLLTLGINVAIIWVCWHFISKFW